MFKGKISIKYNSDWSIDLINKFNCELKIIYSQNIDKHYVIDLLKITNLGRKYSFNDIKDFLEKYDMIEEVELIDQEKSYILIKVSMIMNSLTNNQHFVKNFCFQIGGIQIINYAEIWIFFTPKKDNIKNLIEELKENKDRKIELLSITQYSLNSQGLTDKQYFYFEYLHRQGYFEMPKQITLEEAAKNLDTSSVNINKHINSALKKIVNNFFEQE